MHARLNMATKNLFHLIKRDVIDATTLNKYLLKNPQTTRRIGALPFDWLKPFDKFERSELTQQVHIAFQEFSEQTSCFRGPMGHAKNIPTERFVPAQEKLLNTLKLLLKRDDIKISYAGSGEVKNCHRIDVGNYSYALSTFRAAHACKPTFGAYFKKAHGRGHEPQTIFTAFKRDSQGRWAKPFMAKVSAEKDKGGYILAKFITPKTQPKITKRFLSNQRNYIYNGDNGQQNRRCGRNIEAGGCIANKKYIPDGELRAKWNRFAGIIDNFIVLIRDKHGLDVQNMLLKQVKKGVDITNPKFLKKLKKLEPEEKKLAIKMIRSYKKAGALKDKLNYYWQYNDVKKLLNEDFVDVFPYQDYGKEIPDASKMYPHLLANRLELSNTPKLNAMIEKFYFTYFGEFKINFKEKYTKSEVVEWLEQNYASIRNKPLVTQLSQEFKLKKVIAHLEKEYQALKQQEMAKNIFLQ